MAIFNELGKKISQTTQSAVKSTKEFADTARLNSQIADEQKQINNHYIQIGKKYYDSYRDSAENEFASECTAITDGFAKIEKLEADILVVKGIKKCPNCGEDVAIAVAFCGKCGFDTRNEAEQTQDDTAAATCPNCNKEITDNSAFCNGCGHKLS